MSPEKAKRRISAALWRSGVLKILQMENLKRKNTRVFRVFSIHKSLYVNALKQKWWQDPGSNRGHGDFQSPALPTELSRHFRCCFINLLCFGQNANFFQIFFAEIMFFAQNRVFPAIAALSSLRISSHGCGLFLLLRWRRNLWRAVYPR